jgi:hypothetical protein
MRFFVSSALAVAFFMPALAHAEGKVPAAVTTPVTTPAKADAKSDPKRPAKPAKPAPKVAAKAAPKAAPKKVASLDPKGATPKKADVPAAKPVAAPAKPVKAPCVKAPVEVTTGVNTDRFTLATCDGHAAPHAVDQLSIVARAGHIAKPAQSLAELAKLPGENVAPGIRRFDPGLLVRLQRVVDHFAKPGETTKITVVSGYRPASKGSYHSTAHALDFRVDGVKNEALVAFCKTFDDTGCGYYPNSYFVHMDVRAGAGHVSWIDVSGPGEKPTYVTTWPLPKTPPALALPSSPRAPQPLGPATHGVDDEGPLNAADDDEH